MMKFTLILTAIAIFATGCVISGNRGSQNAQNNSTANPKPSEEAAKSPTKDESKDKDKDSKETTAKKTESGGDKAECLKAKMDGKNLIADQTFVFDYEPFPKSCFVTFGSKTEMLDEKDVARGSTFQIYKNGKLEYEFPDAFDGAPACWVEGVGFEDLNGDGDTDVIIAGKCPTAKLPYPANAVYENYNDDFRTFASQNESLGNFETVGAIKDYVKKNKNKFFDN